MPRLVWGIKVIPEKATANFGVGLHGMDFQLEFARGAPGRLFYSNKELAAFLEGQPKLQNSGLGYIRYTVRPGMKIVERTRYYPFANISDPKDPLQRTALSALQGKGIARALWKATARHMQQKYRGFAYKEGQPAMYYHRHAQQLERMGIVPGQQMAFSTLFRKMAGARRRKRPL